MRVIGSDPSDSPWGAGEEGILFELENFISDCCSAIRRDPTHMGIADLVGRAVSDPSGILAQLGEPKASDVLTLYRSPELTIMNVIWHPGMTVSPQDAPDKIEDVTIDFEQGAALVIGMDVGTTITAAIATVGGSAGSRRGRAR